MTPTPPYFQSQMEEQKKWDDGFKAGIAEVTSALTEGVYSSDLDVSAQEWVQDFSDKMVKKYM